jgi:hypothetical protein
MGTWDIGNFDNDTAADCALRLVNASDLSLVEETINHIFDESKEYLDSVSACEALVAIEVVARLKGNWGEKSAYSEPVDKWVKLNKFDVPHAIVESSIKAIERIPGENSELNDLWSETGQHEEWLKEVEGLKIRVLA